MLWFDVWSRGLLNWNGRAPELPSPPSFAPGPSPGLQWSPLQEHLGEDLPKDADMELMGCYYQSHDYDKEDEINAPTLPPQLPEADAS